MRFILRFILRFIINIVQVPKRKLKAGAALKTLVNGKKPKCIYDLKYRVTHHKILSYFRNNKIA